MAKYHRMHLSLRRPVSMISNSKISSLLIKLCRVSEERLCCENLPKIGLLTLHFYGQAI